MYNGIALCIAISYYDSKYSIYDFGYFKEVFLFGEI